MNTIELPYAQLMYQDSVIHVIFKKNAKLGLAEVQELTRCVGLLSDQKPYYVFSDTREQVYLTPQAMKLAAGFCEAPLHKGTAVLVESGKTKGALHTFGQLVHPSVPYRVFTERIQATNWLKFMCLLDEPGESSACA